MAQFVDTNPILRTPYEGPVTYLELDAAGRPTRQILKGRRPNTISTGILGEDGIIIDLETTEPHRPINKLREVIKEWRVGGWQGTTTGTQRPLEFWQQIDAGVGVRPFWRQMEAIETVIWLFEAGQVYDPAVHKKVSDKLASLDHLMVVGDVYTKFIMWGGGVDVWQ